jgi:Fic-DOC domain mobile mystery protein B
VKIETPKNSTPLSDEDLKGLKIKTIQTLSDLNIAEEINITKARRWSQTSRIIKNDLLEWKGLRELHRKMFGDVWEWSGRNRIIQTNIGCPPEQITQSTAALLKNTKFWIDNKVFPIDEIAIMLHHQLVLIHPFRNGNGRHARRVAELVLYQNGGRTPTWGGNNLSSDNQLRSDYISALKKADQGDYSSLIEFSFLE